MKRRRTITFEKQNLIYNIYLTDSIWSSHRVNVISDNTLVLIITEICEELEIKLIKIYLTDTDKCKIILKCTLYEKTSFMNLLARQLQNEIKNLEG